MLLLIDNHDSFTYNIAQYLKQLGQKLTIWKNDEATVEDVAKLSPAAIIIGPGPCDPDSAGITLPLIATFAGDIPILGVCLGHQAIVQAFGGKVIRANQVMHGRISKIFHGNQGVFAAIHNPFNATRYHSLVVDGGSLPACFEVTAWTESDKQQTIDEIMAVRHKELAIQGVQFHPESILSEAGFMLFNNFLTEHGLAIFSNDELPQVL